MYQFTKYIYIQITSSIIARNRHHSHIHVTLLDENNGTCKKNICIHTTYTMLEKLLAKY